MLPVFESYWPCVIVVIHLSPFCPFSSLARLLFPPVDDNLLKYNYDDNQRVEPEWYIPIIPMVLVNGAEGIGTGWASKIPNYDIREIVANIRRMLNGDEPLPMVSTGPGSPASATLSLFLFRQCYFCLPYPIASKLQRI